MPQLTQEEIANLFPLGFSPEDSDLKLAAGIGLERGWINPADYAAALIADKALSPMSFLQTVSGKALGETIAPLIAQFWLADPDESFTKMPASAYYDFGWIPNEVGRLIRVELKTSSEANPNFQQIRHPKMSGGNSFDYDALLCLAISNEGIEWWLFPAKDVEEFVDSGNFPAQHGGQKMSSGTYWIRMNVRNRRTFESYACSSEVLRNRFLALTSDLMQ
jgi:hypothetical protein